MASLLHDFQLREDQALVWLQSLITERSSGLSGLSDVKGNVLRADDAALELYSAWKRRRDDPENAVSTFLRVKGQLAAVDYLLFHRLARVLETEFQVVVKTPRESKIEPLQLVWSSLSLLKTSYRRHSFEQGDSWDTIEVSIVVSSVS